MIMIYSNNEKNTEIKDGDDDDNDECYSRVKQKIVKLLQKEARKRVRKDKNAERKIGREKDKGMKGSGEEKKIG